MAAASAPPSTETTSYARCGAKTRAGTPCLYPAGRGTDHLGYGNCKHHGGRTPSGKKHAAGLQARALAEPLGIEPLAAIQQSLNNENGMLAFLEVKVRALRDDQVVSKDVLNFWIREWRRANREVAHLGKIAADAGVDERHVRVLEQFANEVYELLKEAFDEVGLTPAQRELARPVVHRHLVALESGTAA